MNKPNFVSSLLLSILFTVVTVGSSIAAAPSSKEKFGKCADAKGRTLHDIKPSNKHTGEKCCYPRNKKTGLKTCIKCIYPGGDSSKAICTKNQFKSGVTNTPTIGSQNLPTTNASPKPLTQWEMLERGRLNPKSTPGEMATPEAPTPRPTPNVYEYHLTPNIYDHR